MHPRLQGNIQAEIMMGNSGDVLKEIGRGA